MEVSVSKKNKRPTTKEEGSSETHPTVTSLMPLAPEAGPLRSLMEKNFVLAEKIYEQNRSINRRLTWMVIGNYLRLVLILAPLILGIIFLPPLIAQLWQQYTGLIGMSETSGGNSPSLFNIGSAMSGEDIGRLLQEFQSMKR